MTTSHSAPAGRPRLGYVLTAQPLGTAADGSRVWFVAFRTDRDELIVGRTSAGSGFVTVGTVGDDDGDFGPACIGRRASVDYHVTTAGVVFDAFRWIEES